jgi:hypothetical protein
MQWALVLVAVANLVGGVLGLGLFQAYRAYHIQWKEKIA